MQQPTLFDVQFDEGADRCQPGRVRADVVGIDAHPAGGFGDRDAVRVMQSAHVISVGRAGHQSRPEARQTESAALLLGEADNSQRARGLDPTQVQFVDGQ